MKHGPKINFEKCRLRKKYWKKIKGVEKQLIFAKSIRVSKIGLKLNLCKN